jgi:hypothetical protein
MEIIGSKHYRFSEIPARSAIGYEDSLKDLGDGAFYVPLVLVSGQLESQGQHHKLVPGTQVNAEIHLGMRTVFEYLLSPVWKVAHEAGRER